MVSFRPEYRWKIEDSLIKFVQNGSDIVCIGCFTYEYGCCSMCGHYPIKWHYILENLQTRDLLIVGSECVQNYQVILMEWGYKPEYIVFPYFLKPYTRWILEKNPKAIVFNDGIVLRFTADCAEILKVAEQDENLKSYKYVQRNFINGVEQFVQVNQLGQEIPIKLIAPIVVKDPPYPKYSDDDDIFF